MVVAMIVLQSLARRAAPTGALAPRGLYRAAVFAMGVVGTIAITVDARIPAPVLPLAVLIAALCVCTVTDVECGYIFDIVTLPALAIEVGMAGICGSWESSLQGALACASCIAVLYVCTCGRGIGLGDLKLAACIGAGLGPLGGITAVGAAFVLGAAHALVMLTQRRVARGDSLRFAPYMALGFVASLLWLRVIWE